MGTREHLVANDAKLAGLCLVLGIALGCGSSLKHESEGDGASGTSTGGGAGETGGSSGSGGSSARGGSAAGGSGQGGSSEGGSGQGGSPQGGASGDAGEGGASPIPTRLLLQTGNALFATDPDTAETIEVCSEPAAQVLYDLVDWVEGRAFVFRRHLRSPSAGELLRVALDGSECTSLLLNESLLSAYSPVVGDRVVLATNPMLMSGLPAPNTGDGALARLVGLTSFALDGSPLAVLAPSGVSDARLAGERVLFIGPGEAGGYDFFSALPDASSIVAPVPDAGSKMIADIRDGRVLVNAVASNDVYAVDDDGGNLAALAVGPELDYGVGFVENRVVITRSAPTGFPDETQADLLSVDTNGGELTPLATSADGERLLGQIGDRIIYERATDIYTARLDGSDALPITQTPGVNDVFVMSVGDRILYGIGELGHSSYFSVLADGSGLVTLHEDANSLAAVAGDRVVFYIGSGNYDLVSVPIAGGEPWLLADAAEPEWVVGKLGTTLVIQRGSRDVEAEVLRIDADGSHALRLAASARYVGAVTEACGAVRLNNASPNDCAP